MTFHSFLADLEWVGAWAIAIPVVLIAVAVLLLQVARIGALFWAVATCWNKISREDARALASFLFYLFVVTPAYYAGLLWAMQPYARTMTDDAATWLLMAPMFVVLWMVMATFSLIKPRPPVKLGAGWEPPPPVNRFGRALRWVFALVIYGATVWLATQLFPHWIGTMSYFCLIAVVPPALLPAMALSLRRPAVVIVETSDSFGFRRTP